MFAHGSDLVVANIRAAGEFTGFNYIDNVVTTGTSDQVSCLAPST